MRTVSCAMAASRWEAAVTVGYGSLGPGVYMAYVVSGRKKLMEYTIYSGMQISMTVSHWNAALRTQIVVYTTPESTRSSMKR